MQVVIEPVVDLAIMFVGRSQDGCAAEEPAQRAARRRSPLESVGSPFEVTSVPIGRAQWKVVAEPPRLVDGAGE
jgi:hypothetical protein